MQQTHVLATVDDTPGVWDSFPSATFDLRQLTIVAPSDQSYKITDGDIECTQEVEAEYTYVFNFFGDVSYYGDLPHTCANTTESSAVQYGTHAAQCHTIGTYDPAYDDMIWSLYDKSPDADPSKGVTLSYLPGEACKHKERSLRVNVVCANHAYRLMGAKEIDSCEYEITVESYIGCPRECPVTQAGLCHSQGLCMMELSDTFGLHGSPRCYCYEGRKGSDCSEKTHSSKETTSGSHPEAVQITFLVILTLMFFGLVGAVVYMTMQAIN
uniref:MRH domain-containing protein n=1 Tax=Octactis speculum TaxID=3111310 RepID=A0A7S2FBS1_9STRA